MAVKERQGETSIADTIGCGHVERELEVVGVRDGMIAIRAGPLQLGVPLSSEARQ